jgi:predicted regulator of amino acid metabolism with ACT domain
MIHYFKNSTNQKKVTKILFSDWLYQFLPNFKLKICQKFEISQAKITKWMAVNYFWS